MNYVVYSSFLFYNFQWPDKGIWASIRRQSLHANKFRQLNKVVFEGNWAVSGRFKPKTSNEWPFLFHVTVFQTQWLSRRSDGRAFLFKMFWRRHSVTYRHPLSSSLFIIFPKPQKSLHKISYFQADGWRWRAAVDEYGAADPSPQVTGQWWHHHRLWRGCRL